MTVQRRRSPRERRLHSDLRAMQQLARESSIVSFDKQGNPPDHYRVFFRGQGLWKPDDVNEVVPRQVHEVTITLTSAYPRMIPELAWQTPIFHPNISASGVVCLGGYGTHWVPSLMLDELCHMLWDMVRYKNFDIESPYNREAAVWAKQQNLFAFPVDERPLRNEIGSVQLDEEDGASPASSNTVGKAGSQPEVQFIEPDPSASPNSEKSGDNDIMFIE